MCAHHYDLLRDMEVGRREVKSEDVRYRSGAGAEPIRFEVPGVPISQPRQRHRVIQRSGKAFAMNYTPAKSPVSDYKARLVLFARQAYAGEPIDGPVMLTVSARFPVPVSRRDLQRRIDRGEIPYHISKPEGDNVVKAVQDALNGILWVDDRMIASVTIIKTYAEVPGTVIEVRRL